MSIKFLNVDLDVESERDISLMLDELGEGVFVLHREERQKYYFARLEIDRDTVDADKTINYFCDRIENLSEVSRNIWNNCSTKIFDIGYESGKEPNYFVSKINSTTIKRIASIGGSVNITIYPIDSD